LALCAAISAARNAEDVRALAQSFAALMAAHSAKEERVLYPMCDEMLPDLSGEKLQEMAPQPGFARL
jgi:hemerythrin-like domain-containing protein